MFTNYFPQKTNPREKTFTPPPKHHGRHGGIPRPVSRKAVVQEFAPKKSQDGVLRIIPLGGLEEVGRNMLVLEYGRDILIVDMGLQFPEEDMPGIDYIIPNISYLRGKEKNIKGVIITQGHYDHLGAIPHLISQLNYPPIFTSEMSRSLIIKREEEFNDSGLLNIKTAKDGQKIKLGVFEVEFFEVKHNVPDVLGVIIGTPQGKLAYPSEFKFDYDVQGNPLGQEVFKRLADKKIDALLLDSTRAEDPGRSIPERVVEEKIEEIIKEAQGRIIVATFASLLDRIKQIIKIAQKYNRKIAISGYSMKSNIEIASQMGYIKIDRKEIVPLKEIGNIPDKNLLIFCAGAQGEDNSALMRIANNEHKQIKVKRGDVIVFSSSVIKGNERSVQFLRDRLSRQGAKIYHYKIMDVHSSGHAPQEELKDVIRLLNPRFFIPVHGHYYMRTINSDNAQSVGIPEKNIVLADNGSVIEMTKNEIRLTKEKAPTFYVMVDGLGVGDVGQVVLRDRQMMAQDGMFVIICLVDSKTGEVRGSPDIISRGFVYLRESKDLLRQVRIKIKNIIKESTGSQAPIDTAHIKENLRNKIGEFLYYKTQRRPMVLPVVIEV